MFVRANFVDIYLQGMRDRSMRSGTELAREIHPTDWSTAGNLSNWSSGVQIPRDICTRVKHYLYSAKCSWIIYDLTRVFTGANLFGYSTCSSNWTCLRSHRGSCCSVSNSISIYIRVNKNTAVLSLHTSQVIHKATAYPEFRSMKRLGVFLDGMLAHRRVTPQRYIRLYPFVPPRWRETLRVECLAQEH